MQPQPRIKTPSNRRSKTIADFIFGIQGFLHLKVQAGVLGISFGLASRSLTHRLTELRSQLGDASTQQPGGVQITASGCFVDRSVCRRGGVSSAKA